MLLKSLQERLLEKYAFKIFDFNKQGTRIPCLLKSLQDKYQEKHRTLACGFTHTNQRMLRTTRSMRLLAAHRKLTISYYKEGC